MNVLKFVVPLVGIACLASAAPAVAQTSARAATTAPMAALAPGALPDDSDPEWQRVFTDLFQDSTLPQWRNIGSVAKPDCYTVQDGKLRLQPFSNNKGKNWQCRLTSHATFSSKPHIFAARIKLHTSQGHRSSFWLNSAEGHPQTNEIDVIENSGLRDPAEKCQGGPEVRVSRSYFNGLNHAYYDQYASDDPELNRRGYKHCYSHAEAEGLHTTPNSFHTFHVEYTPRKDIKYYVDGRHTGTLAAPHDTPLNLILTNIDLLNGRPLGDFTVQWVKVWEKKPTPAPPSPPPASPCADNDHWRAQFGTAPYDYKPNSNPTAANQKRYVFDRVFYYSTYADVRAWAQNKVATQGGNLWDHVQWHWLNYGIPQGRTGAATFDPTFYMNTHQDVAAAYGWNNYQGAIDHFVAFGRNEGRAGSLVFDPGFYRSCYGDLAGRTPAELLDHFTVYGMNEGRQGSGSFAPAWYLAAYPDVRAAFGSNNYRGGMIHWISGGRGEGRAGHP